MSLFLMFSWLVSALVLDGSVASAAKATFGTGTDITGSVTVEAGNIEVSIDLSQFNTSLLPNGSYCYTNGLKYHIHELWTHNDTDDYITTGCNATYTGGHWDPWTACSSSTGNTYCAVEDEVTSCVPGSVAWKSGTLGYSCDSTNYTENPYVCEVGDWSGKYGVLNIDENLFGSASHSSAWEVDGTDLAGYSVVFHCSDTNSSRAFCAPFEDTESDTSSDRVTQSSSNSKIASFTELGDSSYIRLNNDDTYDINIDLNGLAIPLSCDYLYYRVYNAKASSANIIINTNSTTRRLLQTGPGAPNTTANGNSSVTTTAGAATTTSVGATTTAVQSTESGDLFNCSGLVSDFYDPTVTCAEDSEYQDEYCATEVQKCGDHTYSYECDVSGDHYSCAPGDLSGKYGNITVSAVTFSKTGIDELMVSLDNLVGKYAVLQCSDSMEVLSCAAFEDYSSGGGSSSHHKNKGTGWWVWLLVVIGVILLIVGVVFLVRFCRKDGDYHQIQSS